MSTRNPKQAPDPQTQKRALTVVIDPRLYKALRLTASAEGTTITAVVTEILDHAVPERLQAALNQIKGEQ